MGKPKPICTRRDNGLLNCRGLRHKFDKVASGQGKRMATNILKITTALLTALALGACSMPNTGLFKSKKTADPVAQTPTQTNTRPKLRPDAPTEPLTEQTATNVTDAQIAKATKPTERPEQDKGLTIASLGLLNQDGFWLSTSLVKTETKGRVVLEKTYAYVNLTLLPNGTPARSGSQLSIATMQVLGVPITSLLPVRVFIR
ncbi:MAG: hypothetical protein QNK92_08025 [Amylibacter sp.]